MRTSVLSDAINVALFVPFDGLLILAEFAIREWERYGVLDDDDDVDRAELINSVYAGEAGKL